LEAAEAPADSSQELIRRTRMWQELNQIYKDYPAKPFLDQFAFDIANGFFERGYRKQADRYYQLAVAGTGRVGARVLSGFGATRIALLRGQRKRAARMFALTYDIARRFAGLDVEAFVIMYTPIIREHCPLDDADLDLLIGEAIDIWIEQFQPAAPDCQP
jgi:hypothetical protein